jgi:hypothetical protein
MIYHYPQFLSIKDYCAKHNMKLRTVHTHIKERKIGYEKVDGIRLLLDRTLLQPENPDAPKLVPINELKLARNFAIDNKYAPRTVYEGIITGKLNAWVAGNHVFIHPKDPSLIDFLKNSRPRKRRTETELMEARRVR